MYNMHCLLHLVEDCSRFGSLDMFSAFPYENNIMSFRHSCHKPHQHLQQIANRRAEDGYVSSLPTDKPINLVYGPKKRWNSHLFPNLPSEYKEFKTLSTKSMYLSINNRDDTIMLNDSSIGIIKNIIVSKDTTFIYVQKFSQRKDFYDGKFPLDSNSIFLCSCLSDNLSAIFVEDIVAKCFRLPYWHDTSFIDPIPDVFVVALLLSSTNDS